jgi:hypothetical protein
MAEMIIPGTYVTVRSEGLISAGRIATGIVGIVGTAMSGPVGEPVTLAGFAAARDLFGRPDDFQQPEDGAHPLTLVRSLELLYGNGASSVVAVRVAGASAASATFTLRSAKGDAVAVLTAKTPGTWANDMQVMVEEAKEDCRVQGETIRQGFDRLRYSGISPSPENRIRIQRGVTKRTETLEIVYKSVVTERPVKPSAPASSGGPPRFFLSGRPVEKVASVNRVRVLDATGNEVRPPYADAKILYGAGAAPAAGEVRIVSNTGELIFEASEVPTSAQVVEATYAVGHEAPQPGQVLVTAWDGKLQFAAGQAPRQADGDILTASYLVDRSKCVSVTLTHGTTAERFVVADGALLAKMVNDASLLATATADATHGSSLPQLLDGAAYFGTGSNTPGNNGADAGRDEYGAGLRALSNMLVNIVVMAGQDAAEMGDVLKGHLKQTEEVDYERIGVIGAAGSRASQFLGHQMSDERVVLVAPGVKSPGGGTLPAAYTAAAVAGLISSLPVQASLTNKVVNVPGLSVAFNRGEQEQLIRRNVLAVVDKGGFRVLKGVTTAGEGTPFSSIPTRRIVDYAKYGVRSAASSYIGLLNNARVRSALRATLDSFLTRMVDDEALTAYELEVTATRAQEIAGEVSVVMTLQPTFSIEYVRVTMILK